MIPFSCHLRSKLLQAPLINSSLKWQQRRKASTSTLFLVHGADGISSVFDPLISKLTCNAHAFRTDSRNYGKDVELPLLSNLANDYIMEMQQIQSEGPYNLVGYSIGADIAFEIAIQLENEYKKKVQNMILLDGYCGFGMAKKLGADKCFEFLFDLIKDIIRLSDSDKKELNRRFDPTDMPKNRMTLVELFEKKAASLAVEIKVEVNKMKSIKQAFESVVTLAMMVNAHEILGKCEGKVHLIETTKSNLMSLGVSSDRSYQQFCVNPITCSKVSGDHFSFLHEENVHETAAILNNILKQNTKTK